MNSGTIVISECPQCGASVQVNSNVCQYCKSEYMVKSLSGLSRMDKGAIEKYLHIYRKVSAGNSGNAELNSAMGMCYLKLGLYDLSSKYFQKALEDVLEDSELYFYNALSVMKGKRPFLLSLHTIRQAEEFLNAAISLDPGKGLYYYALSLIKYDYYHLKRLNTAPSYQELFEQAHANSVTEDDKIVAEDYVSASLV